MTDDQNQSTPTFSGMFQFQAPLQCGWCGMIHGPACPRVKAIEYYADGRVKRVEFIEQQTPLLAK